MHISKLFAGCQRLGLALGLLFAGCAPGTGPQDEPVSSASQAVFVNGDFETGTAGSPPPSLTVTPYRNGGITVQTPQTRAGLALQTNQGDALTTILQATNQPDPDLGAGASLRYCRYGAKCAVVNFHGSSTYGHGRNIN